MKIYYGICIFFIFLYIQFLFFFFKYKKEDLDHISFFLKMLNKIMTGNEILQNMKKMNFS